MTDNWVDIESLVPGGIDWGTPERSILAIVPPAGGLAPPADDPAFAGVVNVSGVTGLRFATSFVITHDQWKALHPLEAADAIENYGPASAWRAEPFVSENASRTASGISLDEARSLFLPHHAAPDGWEYHVEHVDTGEVDEDGNPVMGVRVVMTRRI